MTLCPHLLIAWFQNYQVRANEVVLHDIDVASAIAEYVIDNFIGMIVVGASSRSAITRYFNSPSIPVL